MDKQVILTVNNLGLSFAKGTPVLKDVSFEVVEGEVVGLVGESGSGKSVTSLSIMRLLAKYAQMTGEIIFNGQDLITLSERAMEKVRGKEISMIFQEPMSSLNPSHRCGDQVAEAILVHQSVGKAEAKEKVIGLFEDVMLPEPERIYQSYPHELSGGQLQRVMIAMAISNYPKLIIADEPTTALDVTVQKGIVELLKSIAEKYKTAVVFISHDLGVVRSIADKVIVMQKGEIVEFGKTEQLFLNAEHPYTNGLLACRPPLDCRLKRLPTVSDFIGKDEKELSRYLDSIALTQQEWDARYKAVMQNETLLEVSNLDKWYITKKNWWGKAVDHFKAVNDVSFSLRKGEILGLVGESGSGKTTVGRSILKLIQPTNGTINFEGQDITQYSDKEMRPLRKDYQVIFQDPYSSLNPRMKIGDAIMEPMHIHRVGSTKADRKDRAVQLLETVELEADHMDRYPHQFSGGQRQRICIARTLSLNPKFIVCDESVSALDVSVQAQILNLLLDLKDQFDLSYLFISHDMSVIKFLCDNVMVMKDGRIIEKGTSEEIYRNPKEVYTQELIRAIYR